MKIWYWQQSIAFLLMRMQSIGKKTYILVKNPPWRDSMGVFLFLFLINFYVVTVIIGQSRHNCQNLHYHSYYLPESFARHQKARQKYRHPTFR